MDLRIVTGSNSFRRPSTIKSPSAASILKSPDSQQAAFSAKSPNVNALRNTPTTFFGASRSAPVATPITEEDFSKLDPDELFTRFTVAQVKLMASKLRADADAKQEELRLMVGERYRDLLQASTSIIEMSNSSQQVVDRLDEMKKSCLRQENSKGPIGTSTNAENDSQLKTLQSLAAHLKLLLDCPEQLWRLLEQRQTLQAAWLFLVARVVHHSLIDEEEEAVWSRQGIDVLEQFPLVQRQWDAISGFRSQIAHKATLALRDHLMTVQDTRNCILGLILLESLSLNETLSLLLTQRKKYFQTSLTSGSKLLTSISTNDEVVGSSLKPTNFSEYKSKRGRKKTLKEVKLIMLQAIQLLVDTLNTARLIFGDGTEENSAISLLNGIQSDENTVTVSTQKIISNLPSATVLALYLPAQIQSYTPYVDMSGASMQMSQSHLNSKLEQWFNEGLNSLAERMSDWMYHLNAAADVEEVKSTIFIPSLLQHLSPSEKNALTAIVDQACRKRIAEIWKGAFASLSKDFKASLSDAIDLIKSSDSRAASDLDPAQNLLSISLPFPTANASHISTWSLDSSFAQFDSALRLRKSNRTKLLDDVVSVVEKRVQGLLGDLKSISVDGDLELTDLFSHFEPLGLQFCQKVADYLSERLKSISNQTDQDSANVAVFIGRVASELTQSPLATKALLQKNPGYAEFQKSTDQIQKRALTIWQSNTASQLATHIKESRKSKAVPSENDFDGTSCTRPSSGLMYALVNLASAANRLGLPRIQIEEKHVMQGSLQGLIREILKRTNVSEVVWSKETAQLFWDVLLLQFICKELEVEDLLSEMLSDLQDRCNSLVSPKQVQKLYKQTEVSVKQSIPRLQLLLAPFFAKRQLTSGIEASSLLFKGVPTVETTPELAVNQAQQSPRFGLLLVTSSVRTLN